MIGEKVQVFQRPRESGQFEVCIPAQGQRYIPDTCVHSKQAAETRYTNPIESMSIMMWDLLMM